MKKLFHGSLEIVDTPEIRIPTRTLDYGSGFYLTSSEEQAVAWVKRKLRDEVSVGYLNIYEYDEGKEQDLSVLSFEMADERWVDFVWENRMNRNFSHQYDIVKGPVANDRVYASFALYEAGLIDKTTLINELKAYKLVNQILIHSSRALDCIKFISAKKIKK